MSSSVSCDHSVVCFPLSNLKIVDPKEPEKLVENVEQWVEIRCPICMEPPHNALLLRCSSFEHGCRAYVCDTSSRHTNCFDQFMKRRILVAGCEVVPPVKTVLRPEDLLVGDALRITTRDEYVDEDGLQRKLLCPLCRGGIYEVVKVKNVREFLNDRVRNCSSETCSFSGTYDELRNHSRAEHPDVQPAEADPERLREWEQLERAEHERDLQSAIINPSSTENSDEDHTAYRDLVDCILSVAYHAAQNLLEPLSQSQLHNNRLRRPRVRPRPRPDSSSAVDRRIHGHIGVRRPLRSHSDRSRGIQRHRGTRGLPNTFSGGERRFRGFSEREQFSDRLSRSGMPDFGRRNH